MRKADSIFVAAAVAVAACGPVVATQSASSAAAQEEAAPAPAWSWPETMENAQVLPADTESQRLRGTMIFFVQSLGVRCSYCHVGSGDDLSQYDFASDDNPRKNMARGMMRLTRALNEEQLPAIEGLSEPRVTCYTCHGGAINPPTRPPAQS